LNAALATQRPLVFVGGAAFNGAGQVRVRYDGGDTVVEISLDGSGRPDTTIRLTGRIPLAAADFVLTAA
jgi:hypothetical protein